MTGVILAAGEGKRLGAPVPKPLVKISGKPMLLHIIEKMRKVESGMHVFCVINPSHKELFMHALTGVPGVSLSYQEAPLGTAMALKCALEDLDYSDDLMVMYADLVLIKDESLRKLTREHTDSEASITFLSGLTKKQYPYALVERDEEGIVKRLSERKKPDFPPPWEFYIGPIVVHSEVAKRFIDALQPHPETGERYIPDLANLAIDNGYKVSSVTTEDETEFLGVNKPEDLEFARSTLGRTE
ncbi:MAG: N-acetylglucosamine-1-phosphate uridylyltransferase/acetyltransferase [Thermotogales bacterium 46_20]|nr:MAG: N-acetylglucosamine-1-phosphate uridylyltransferase/acetyltransferase [Thermotogales bacterium 46_20]